MRRSFSRSFGVKKGQSMILIKTISCIKRVSSGFKILITDLRPKSINLQLLQLTKRSHINSQLIQWPMCPFDHVGARDRMGLNKTQPLRWSLLTSDWQRYPPGGNILQKRHLRHSKIWPEATLAMQSWQSEMHPWSDHDPAIRSKLSAFRLSSWTSLDREINPW